MKKRRTTMSNASVYDNLYNNMKSAFTVVSDNCEYSLGDYMRMKANAKSSNLPVPKSESSSNGKIVAVFSYVNNKLTVKKAPVKDKTIRSFPFRTSAAAFLSAIVACAMIFSYGIFSVRNSGTTTTPVVEAEELPEEEIQESTPIATSEN